MIRLHETILSAAVSGIFAVGCGAAAPMARSAEMVRNGSMEEGRGSDGIATWMVPPGMRANGERRRSREDAHSGEYGKGLRATGRAPFIDVQSLSSPPATGEKVVLSAWLRANREGSLVTVRLRFSENHFEDVVGEPLPDDDWHFFSKEMEIPSGAEGLAVACIVGPNGDGSFDDVSLTLAKDARTTETPPPPIETVETASPPFPAVPRSEGPGVGLPLGVHDGQTNILETLDLMRDSGMNLLHVELKWNEIEVSPGEVDLSRSRGGYETASKYLSRYPELQAFVVVVKMIDTNVRTVPGDLEGRKLDHPDVLRRFDAVVDALAGSNVASRLSALLVGNEVDMYLAKHPDEVDATVRFLEHAKERIHEKLPNVMTGTIFTAQGVVNHPELFDRLSTIGDLVVYTYYPIAAGMRMKGLGEIRRDLDGLVERAGSRPFAFTEAGCSSSRLNGSSPEYQADFVRELFLSLDGARRSGQLEFLHYMTTYDLPDDFSKSYAGAQGVTSPGLLAFLKNLGLREGSGSAKPAWDVFVAGVAAWRSGADLGRGFESALSNPADGEDQGRE